MPEEENKNRRASFMEIMKNQILSGELKPGDRLPPERELAEQLGFSRGSVNQGMLDLARMGFCGSCRAEARSWRNMFSRPRRRRCQPSWGLIPV